MYRIMSNVWGRSSVSFVILLLLVKVYYEKYLTETEWCDAKHQSKFVAFIHHIKGNRDFKSGAARHYTTL